MVRRIIVITLAVLIFTTNPTCIAATENRAAAAHVVDEAARQRILAATVRITMVAREQSAGEPAYAVSNGLGTVVRDGGVFAGTQLVGTMWETIRLRDLENGRISSTNLSRAARFTFDGEPGAELATEVTEAPQRGGEF